MHVCATTSDRSNTALEKARACLANSVPAAAFLRATASTSLGLPDAMLDRSWGFTSCVRKGSEDPPGGNNSTAIMGSLLEVDVKPRELVDPPGVRSRLHQHLFIGDVHRRWRRRRWRRCRELQGG